MFEEMHTRLSLAFFQVVHQNISVQDAIDSQAIT